MFNGKARILRIKICIARKLVNLSAPAWHRGISNIHHICRGCVSVYFARKSWFSRSVILRSTNLRWGKWVGQISFENDGAMFIKFCLVKWHKLVEVGLFYCPFSLWSLSSDGAIRRVSLSDSWKNSKHFVHYWTVNAISRHFLMPKWNFIKQNYFPNQ